jgi:hypothetical protein
MMKRHIWVIPVAVACIALLVAGKDDIQRFRAMRRI